MTHALNIVNSIYNPYCTKHIIENVLISTWNNHENYNCQLKRQVIKKDKIFIIRN